MESSITTPRGSRAVRTAAAMTFTFVLTKRQHWAAVRAVHRRLQPNRRLEPTGREIEE